MIILFDHGLSARRRRTPGTSGEKLVNGLIEQFHYLGYCYPVGEQLKYMVCAQGRSIKDGNHMPESVYRHRNPQDSPYYQCVEDYFEIFEQVYEDRFERRYGFYRPYIGQVMLRYLDCGDLNNGFSRVRCEECGHEYLLSFSCKRRHFCPSCRQKRGVEFGDWLCRKVVKAVPHRHVVLSIPKILRRYFLYDRKLLSELSRCGWETLKAFYTTGMRDTQAVPGAVVAIQTFGDFPGFHPHLHILVSDGCFHKNGMFSVYPSVF